MKAYTSHLTLRERIASVLLYIAFKQRRYRQSALAASIAREYLIPAGTPIKLTRRQSTRLAYKIGNLETARLMVGPAHTFALCPKPFTYPHTPVCADPQCAFEGENDCSDASHMCLCSLASGEHSCGRVFS
jgi:hypothetical protein